MAIWLPERDVWKRQPARPFSIDWSHPYARNLYFAWAAGMPVQFGQQKATVTKTGTAPLIVNGKSQVESGYETQSFDGSTHFTAGQLPDNAGALSGVMFADCASCADDFALCTRSTSTGAGFDILFGAGATAGTVQLRYSNANRSFGTGLNDGFSRLYGWTFGFDPSSGNWNSATTYLNGAPVQTASITVSDVHATSVRIGSRNGSLLMADGSIAFVLMWVGRALSAEDHKAIADNPWQIFE